ncbi:MAG: glycoside hydrolase family 2 TIM barrel-domain containing protein, partial [Cyclobacteriaceae bacterium]
YDLKLTLKDQDNKILDEVNSYFGMRKISLGDHQGVKYLFLNNKPLFHYGPLDQGWWPDGLHTPPSDEGMRWDIEKTKALGFNAIRKHIKIEPDRWYYHCDQLGMLVWQDMPSGMVVLPPQGEERPNRIQHVSRTGPDLFRRTEETAQFEYELRRMIDLHHNAPSIVMWVPFNEGWGQYETCRISDWVKAYDPSRLVNAVSGWALRPCGDIYDIHSYQVEVHTPPTSLSQASVLGEYGGIGYPIKGHQWNPDMRNWGYQTYHSEEELLKSYTYKFDQIVEMKKSKGLSAAIYTQTTDVEGEVNGLITYDREVIKFPEEKLKEMHSVLYEE